MNLCIHGHANFSTLIYSTNGLYREAHNISGALLIQTILRSIQLQDVSIQENGVPAKAEDILPPIEGGFATSDNYRREYWELAHVPDNQNRLRYVKHRHIGDREGKNTVYTLPPNHPAKPFDLIVWDEGFGGISIPDGCNTVLWASNKALPDRIQFEKIQDRCILFIDADVLRTAGAMISRQISWERTASELIWQLQHNGALAYILKAKYLLIPFAEDGAVYIDNSSSEMTASLILTHGGAEGFLRESNPAFAKGAEPFALMASILATLYLNIGQTAEAPEPLRIVLEVGAEIMLSGYDIGNDSDNVSLQINVESKNWSEFVIPLKREPNSVLSVNNDWTITDRVDDEGLLDVAIDYVVNGAEVIEGFPQLSFGALTTVDRWEIEAYQNIRNLIIGYANGSTVRPLSIAVFGSPGSGKSFGVTQIAQNVLPGKVEKLEFNVSQFTSLADLGKAFQNVRDTILGGKLPLVFFDEFDSDRDGLPLGWVKSFLMPMQDGKFKDESGEHPLGKCILVFAGGTASSFEEFIAPMDITKSTPELQAQFKNVKGPDFISRLRGTINVLGPNRKTDSDKNYILRRALLLRGLCERKLKFSTKLAPVSRDIIRAMLQVPEYKHGARSMEAILDMSRIDGHAWEPVSLPAYSQLALHVDADAFIKLVLNEV